MKAVRHLGFLRDTKGGYLDQILFVPVGHFTQHEYITFAVECEGMLVDSEGSVDEVLVAGSDLDHELAWLHGPGLLDGPHRQLF